MTDLENQYQFYIDRWNKVASLIEKLLKQIDLQNGVLADRNRRIDELTAALSKYETVPVDTGPRFSVDEFERRAQIALGITTGWQRDFHKQTGTAHKDLADWRESGFVPHHVFKMLDVLKPVKPKKRSRWTGEIIMAMKEIMKAGKVGSKAVAAELNQRFNTTFTENSINSKIYELKLSKKRK